MSWRAKWAGKSEGRMELAADKSQDPALEQALENFRLSIHAWSDAAYNRPRTAAKTVRHWSWRLATSCALGCVLVAGSVAGGVYERHQRQEMARIAAQQAAQQKLAAEQRAREEEEDLLAKVDSDVSREVPSAMEPLAQLMAEDEAQ